MIRRYKRLNKTGDLRFPVRLTAALSIPCLVVVSLGLGQESSPKSLSEQVLQDAYSAHLNRVRKMLPPHSGLPPLLDLSKSESNDVGRDRAWESMFKGIMGTRVITDPGARRQSEATSVLTNFIDTVGQASALPVRSSDAVMIASPIANDVHISEDRTYVYSRFSLQVFEVLKRSKKADIREGSEIAAVQLGGGIRFPSGHMATFILARHGFLDLGQKYLLFVWKPATSINIYVASEAYLIQGGAVFPIGTVADASAYDGMPLKDFETKVRLVIAKNVNSN
jgi:hypothetical protein